jgi:hypothetical protein
MQHLQPPPLLPQLLVTLKHAAAAAVAAEVAAALVAEAVVEAEVSCCCCCCKPPGPQHLQRQTSAHPAGCRLLLHPSPSLLLSPCHCHGYCSAWPCLKETDLSCVSLQAAACPAPLLLVQHLLLLLACWRAQQVQGSHCGPCAWLARLQLQLCRFEPPVPAAQQAYCQLLSGLLQEPCSWLQQLQG